jgi:hypothetical protein
MVQLKVYKIISFSMLIMSCVFNLSWIASILVHFLTASDIAFYFIVKAPLILLLSMSDMPKALWLICFAMVLLCWMSIFVLSILSFFIKKVRIPLYALSIFAALYDVIFSFIFSAVEMKISALFMFMIVFSINMLFIAVQIVSFVFEKRRKTVDGGVS